MRDVLPRVGRELVVGDAELVPVDGRQLEGRVVALEGEGRGVWVCGPGLLECGWVGLEVRCVLGHIGSAGGKGGEGSCSVWERDWGCEGVVGYVVELEEGHVGGRAVFIGDMAAYPAPFYISRTLFTRLQCSAVEATGGLNIAQLVL